MRDDSSDENRDQLATDNGYQPKPRIDKGNGGNQVCQLTDNGELAKTFDIALAGKQRIVIVRVDIITVDKNQYDPRDN